MSARERDRGARAERAVVNFLRANGWPDARRYLAGDGRQPGDVDFHPLVCLEVKDRAESRWPTWCRQAASEAREGMVPVVVRRTRGVPDAGQWECRVQWAAWRGLAGRTPLRLDFGRVLSWSNLMYPTDGMKAVADGDVWAVTTLAEFVSALRRFDVIDGAA